MFGMGWLTKCWNEHQERVLLKKHRDAQLKALTQAIKDKDHSLVESILASTEGLDKFKSDNYDELLKEAILTDDVNIFEKIFELAKNPDPNHIFHWHSPAIPSAVSMSSSRNPLLSTALEAKAGNVALRLANDPRTDIYLTGSYDRHRYHGGGLLSSGYTEHEKTIYSKASVLAEKHGLNEVAAVLMKREAADLTARAQSFTLS